MEKKILFGWDDPEKGDSILYYLDEGGVAVVWLPKQTAGQSWEERLQQFREETAGAEFWSKESGSGGNYGEYKLDGCTSFLSGKGVELPEELKKLLEVYRVLRAL